MPYECFNEFSEGNPNYTGPSNADIQPLQSNITYWDALYSMMLASACESANILAYNIGGGSIEHFCEMMNCTQRIITPPPMTFTLSQNTLLKITQAL